VVEEHADGGHVRAIERPLALAAFR